MKSSEVSKQVLAGRPLMVVEYRATEVDMVNRKVVKAGEAATMPILKHKVLVGNDSWELAQFVKDGVDPSKVAPPGVMRDLIVVEVAAMERTKYGNRMSGEILGKLES